jgi:hypothetical protein
MTPMTIITILSEIYENGPAWEYFDYPYYAGLTSVDSNQLTSEFVDAVQHVWDDVGKMKKIEWMESAITEMKRLGG